MSVWTFAGQSVLDRWEATQAADDLGEDMPAAFDRANSVLIPGGGPAGRGWLLLTRASLLNIDFDAIQDLVITDNDGKPHTLHGWLPIQAESLFNSKPADDASIYLLEIGDARWRLHNDLFAQQIDVQFNVRAPCYRMHPVEAKRYYADTTYDATTAHTWDTMLHAMWSLLGGVLGTYPGIPSTPDGKPEDVIYVGVSAWQAFCEQLDRCGFTIRVDLSHPNHPYTIVRLGDADAAALAEVTKAEGLNRRLASSECIESLRGKKPAKVATLFHYVQEVYGNEQEFSRGRLATEEQTEGGGAGSCSACDNWHQHPIWDKVVAVAGTDGEPHVSHPLLDEFPAAVDCAGPYEEYPWYRPDPDDVVPVLTARATDRADSYYRHVGTVSGSRVFKEFSGVLPVTPGSSFKSVAYLQDDEGGTRTEVRCYPTATQEITDEGAWITPDNPGYGTAARRPELAPSWPLYPSRKQMTRLIHSSGNLPFFDDTVGIKLVWANFNLACNAHIPDESGTGALQQVYVLPIGKIASFYVEHGWHNPPNSSGDPVPTPEAFCPDAYTSSDGFLCLPIPVNFGGIFTPVLGSLKNGFLTLRDFFAWPIGYTNNTPIFQIEGAYPADGFYHSKDATGWNPGGGCAPVDEHDDSGDADDYCQTGWCPQYPADWYL